MTMKSCCICFSLRTGGIIIGVLDLVGSIIGAVGCAVLLGFFAFSTNIPDSFVDPSAKKRESFWDVTNSTTESTNVSSSTNDIEDESKQYIAVLLVAFVSILLYITLVLCVVQILIASFLLYGIRKQITSYMKVWLIFKVVFLAISIVSMILMLFVSFNLQDIITKVLAIALNIYFIKVIYDLRKVIGQQLDGNPHVMYSAKA